MEGTADLEIMVPAKDKTVITQNFFVKEPRLWDIIDPFLYLLCTQLVRGTEEVDCVETRFGFRTIAFDAGKGFFLNGRQVKIQGVCSHQDCGLTGKAMPDNLHRYRIELLKEMGANGYRTTHYPHAQATMDALDEMGFLVMDETRWFESTEEGKAQLEMLVKRDRNRPSVILWSIGNEEPLHETERGCRIAESLKAVIRKLDDTRPVTTAVSYCPQEAPVMEHVDVMGVNYSLEAYEILHKRYPDTPIFSSECCATGTTRGWYEDDNPVNGYINAYDHDTNAWFLGRENTWRFLKEREWVMGGYQWIGIEHRGETMWPRLCSQSGAIDMFLQKKDAFYQNQSFWLKTPVLHILPHWNHPGREGETIKVWCYTNCEEVEAFLNGKSLGIRKIQPISHGEWKIPYEPGILKMTGKIDGKTAAEDWVETSGQPAELHLRQDNVTTRANGQDIAVVTCYCTDDRGRIVPDASVFLRFHTNCLGTVVGTGSDVSDPVPVPCTDRRMRAGLCSVAVRVGKQPGELKVYAESAGLKSACLSVKLQ